MQIYFNPLDFACKNIVGGVKEGEVLQLNVFCLKSNEKTKHYHAENGVFTAKTPTLGECKEPKENACFRFFRDGEAPECFAMQKTEFGWTISLKIPNAGLYYYSFKIEGIGFISCGYMEMGEITEKPIDFLLTVSTSDYHTPDWFKGGVMYQIFPDRFYKVGNMPDIIGRVRRTDWGGLPSYKPNAQGKVLNNDFFGGNLQGIIEKLPYLKALGITVLYLNPIFEAASNHRYDTSDYKKIDPFLGDETIFSQLIESAKNQGIQVILDGVFNHTGDDSVYFNKYGNYPSVGAYQSKDSLYYSWYSFQEFPNKYSSWWGIDILPETNENSESYQEFIFGQDGVLKKWLRFGIGGYRLDVADELPDFFLQKLRKSVKDENSEAIIIGEVWEDASNKIAYSKRREYLQGHELDSVMNYPLKDAIIRYMQTENASELLHCIRVLINHYPKETLDALMNILGTHDTARILTVLGGIYCNNKDEMARKTAYLSEKAKENAIEKLKLAAVLQFTMPGIPCIYYGDENGMEGHIDPFCRQCFDWTNLNTDLINFYKSLGKLREKYRHIFKTGNFEEIHVENGLIYFKRTFENQSIYICVNNSSKNYLLDIAENYVDCLTEENFEKEIFIKPYSFKIFAKK